MTIQEARDILNKLSPDGLRCWMTDWHQMLVQTAILEVSASIDIKELDGLSDGEIKELIRNRTINALEDKLSVLKGK